MFFLDVVAIANPDKFSSLIVGIVVCGVVALGGFLASRFMRRKFDQDQNSKPQ